MNAYVPKGIRGVAIPTLTLVTLLAPTAWVAAATPAKPAATKPAPASTAVKPATAPAKATAAVKTLSLDFRDADIDQVLKAYSLASGLTVVKDPSVKGTVTIIASGKLTLDQAFEVLNSMLSFRGCVLRRTDRLLTVLPVSKAYEPGVVTAGSPTGSEAIGTGRIITQVHALKRSNALELKRELAPVLSENAQMMVSTQTNTLIVTDFDDNVRQLSDIIGEIEKGNTTAANAVQGQGGNQNRNNRTSVALTEVIPIRYANAADLARSLTTLFAQNTGNNRNGNAADIPFEQRIMGGAAAANANQGGGGQSPTVIIPMPVPSAAPAGNGASGAAQGQQAGGGFDATALAQLGSLAQALRGQASQATAVQTRVVADTYSNSLIITGSQEAIVAIRSVVAAVDQEGAASITYVYRVRFGKAVDLANTVLNLYGANTTYRGSAQSTVLQNQTNSAQAAVSATGANRQQGTATGAQATNNNRTNTANNNRNNAANQLLQGLLGTNNNRQANANRTATASRPRITTDMKVVPDEPTNTIIITGPKEVVDEITDLLKKVDVAPPQVHIEAVIAEVSLDQGNKLGISWESLADPKANVGLSNLNWGMDDGLGLKSQVIAGGIKAIIDTIRNDSRFNVLSTPSVMTVNNSQATMYVGKQVPYVTDTTTKDNVVQKTYTYRPVGVTLQVFPRITESGYISLDIYQDSSEAVKNSEAGAPPVISSRNAKTSVMVKHGETVVIGGIIREDKTQTVRKLPFLGDLPIIGALFRRTEEVTNKTELMIFITPQIVRNQADALALTDSVEDRLSQGMKDTIVLPRPVPTLSQAEIEARLATEAAKAPEAAAQTPPATVEAPAPVEPTVTAPATGGNRRRQRDTAPAVTNPTPPTDSETQ